MRLAWATDVHLPMAQKQERTRFFDSVSSGNPDALVITGDIAEGRDIDFWLREIVEELQSRDCLIPIYFVLGNHDFYHDSIENVRERMRSITQKSDHLKWLPEVGVVRLSYSTALVGHDGFYDGVAGKGPNTEVSMTDFTLVNELAFLDRDTLFATIKDLAASATKHIKTAIKQAFQEGYERVIVATHVPPFPEAAWYRGGETSDEDHLPFYVNTCLGRALKKLAKENPTKNIVVLTGHSHGGGTVDVAPNLTVVTGAARYGLPRVNEFVDTM